MAGPLKKPPRGILGHGFRMGNHAPLSDASLSRRVTSLEEQVYELTKGFEEYVNETEAFHDQMVEQIAESNLRLLYVMQWFKIKATAPPSSVIGADGHPVAGESRTIDLYTLYLEQRDQFKADLQRRLHAEREAAQTAATGNGQGHGHGQSEGEKGRRVSDGPSDGETIERDTPPNLVITRSPKRPS